MNVLHRRKEQIENWESSITNKEKLVERQPDRVNFSDPVKYWAACSNRDIPEIKRLLALGVDVNVAKVDGLTALHQACIDNAYDIVKFLLDHGADPNIQDNEGWTPLHATSSCDFSEIARLLIDRNANTGITSNDNELPIDIANNNQMREILVEAMKKQGVEEAKARNFEHDCLLEDSKKWLETPDEYSRIIDPKTGASPIHVASAKDYVDILKILIQIPGIDVNFQDIDGWTPLHAAAHWGKEESVRLLVGAGASFDILTFANQSIMDVSDSSLTMTLKQLREQRRLYNLSVGQKENYPESKNAKRKSDETSESNEPVKNAKSQLDSENAKKPEKKELNENTDQESSTEDKTIKEILDNKKSRLDSKDEKEKSKEEIFLRNKSCNESETNSDKLLKDISNVPKDKSISSASSTSSTSSSSSYNRRVSAIMAPTKAEETETQRSIRARHVRSTRRSTQGITNETLEEARRLTQESPGDTQTAEADSSTNPNFNDSEPNAGQSNSSSCNKNSNSNETTNDESNEKNSSDPVSPQKEPTIRPWRQRMNLNNNNNSSADSTTDSASIGSMNSGSNKVSLRRHTRDRVPTGKVNQADLDAANEQLRENNSSSVNRQSSSDDPLTPTSGRTQPTRYTSRYTSLNGNSSNITNNGSGQSTTTGSSSPNANSYSSSKNNENRTISALTNSSTGYSSVRNSPSRSGNFSALSSSNTPPPQSSWRDSSNIDYRRLYEEEKTEKDRLKRQLESLNRQVSELNSELNRLQLQNNTSDTKSYRRTSQCDDTSKELTALREQNARMKEENGALIRVISKLSRPG